MKKILALTLALVLLIGTVFTLASCGKDKDETQLRIGFMNGPTGLGMAELIATFTGLNVITYDDPEYSLVKGAAVALSKPELLRNINYQERSIRELEIR